jgi:hypothetical protein
MGVAVVRVRIIHSHGRRRVGEGALHTIAGHLGIVGQADPALAGEVNVIELVSFLQSK